MATKYLREENVIPPVEVKEREKSGITKALGAKGGDERTHTIFERSGNVSSTTSISFNLFKGHNLPPHPRLFSLIYANKNTPLCHTT